MPFSNLNKIRYPLWSFLVVSYPLFALFSDSAAWLTLLPLSAILFTFFFVARLSLSAVLARSFAFALLILFIFFSFLFFAFDDFDAQKLNQYLMVVFVFGFLLAFCLVHPYIFANLHIGFMLAGLVAMLLIFMNPSAYQEGRVTFEDSNPIWMARAIGMAGIAGVFYLTKIRLRVVGYLVVFASLVAISMTGSRGPLVALLVTLIYGVFFADKSARLKHFTFLSLLVGFVFLFVYVSDFLAEFRAFQFLGGGGGESTDSRWLLYDYSLGLISANPAGIGIGNFSYYGLLYSHNIFLEFLVEWGWFLGGVQIILVILGGARLMTLSPEFNILKFAFLTEIINAMFSGDVTSPRMLYALVFIGLFGFFFFTRRGV